MPDRTDRQRVCVRPSYGSGSALPSQRIEHDYRELKHGLGIDHFEGRSYTGWHRHLTLATAAQAFCTLLRSDPKAPTPA
ncbi:SRSO17 transposase [Catenulispora sp. GAS73]